MTKREFDIIMPDTLESMNEKQFQSVVIEIGQFYGWDTVYHTRFSMKSSPGYPDLTMFDVWDGGAIWIEVKVKNNKPTQAQCDWLWRIRASGNHAYIAHPAYIDLLMPIFNGEMDTPVIGGGTPDPRVAPLCPETPGEWRLP